MFEEIFDARWYNKRGVRIFFQLYLIAYTSMDDTHHRKWYVIDGLLHVTFVLCSMTVVGIYVFKKNFYSKFIYFLSVIMVTVSVCLLHMREKNAQIPSLYAIYYSAAIVGILNQIILYM